MADEDEDIGDDEDAESYSYDYSADAAGNGPAADCADCRGTGKVQLLFTARPCEKCGGTGKVNAGRDVSCEVPAADRAASGHAGPRAKHSVARDRAEGLLAPPDGAARPVPEDERLSPDRGSQKLREERSTSRAPCGYM
jgi:hypothetical protein